MRVLKVDPAAADRGAIDEAATHLRRGGLVAFPTETVYGLGADATDPSAIAKIFEAKGRPSYNPLIVHVAAVPDAQRCVTAWPAVADQLARRFWPGPLTLVLPKHARIAEGVTAGLPSVGLRVPAHPVALELLRAAGVPVAAPSANRSTEVSPTRGSHVLDSLGSVEGILLDAGPVPVGIESTVLDLTAEVPTILRPGMISRELIANEIGEVRSASHAPGAGEARPSPGMMDKHYSPRAKVIVVDGSEVEAVGRKEARRGRRVLALVFAPRSLGDERLMSTRTDEYARVLYATLRDADAAGYECLVIERVPDDSEWDGVRDRLTRASR